MQLKEKLRKLFTAVCIALPFATMAQETHFYSTYPDHYMKEAPTAILDEKIRKSDSLITLSVDKTYQSMLGFGASFTDAACYMIDQLEPRVQEELLKDLFSPEGLNLSVGRLNVGSSDYARVPYNYAPRPNDLKLASFNILYDKDYIIPVVKKSLLANKDLFLLSSPWSPPGWMKTSNTMYGGAMKDEYLETYASYYLKYLQAYKEEGVTIHAMTTQNEVDTQQRGKMPACLWSAEQESRFITDYMGPMLKQSGLDTKIWLLDHNFDLTPRVLASLENEKLRSFVDGIAYHPYKGKPEMMQEVLQKYPDMNLYLTERGPHLPLEKWTVDWAFWGNMISSFINNGCSAFIGWNLALDENGKPNIGPFVCAGMVTIHSQTTEVLKGGQYRTLWHFSHFVKRGAKRIDYTTNLKSVAISAFVNPDGSIVTVLTNPGSEMKIGLKTGSSQVKIMLPANSVSTVVM